MNRRLFLLVLLLSFASLAGAATLTGRVVGVSDGDTITVLDSTNDQHKVRLAGIDAPEKAQPFGSRSKARLSSLVYGKTVTVEFVKFDRYQRMVGKVIGPDGTDLCLEQIKTGLA
jgi:endonuclease YncB( thermonuclease family)